LSIPSKSGKITLRPEVGMIFGGSWHLKSGLRVSENSRKQVEKVGRQWKECFPTVTRFQPLQKNATKFLCVAESRKGQLIDQLTRTSAGHTGHQSSGV
jgi:hypothetical protein